MTSEKIILGGRVFVPVTESTVEHDLHFQGLVGRAGLRLDIGDGESTEEFADRILEESIKSGKTLDLLGCLVVPDDVGVEGWTPEEAQTTAAFIGQLRGEKDKARVRGLILSLFLNFFRCGLASIWTSESSSKSQPVTNPIDAQTSTGAGALS
jgi:hypothetical protein